MPARPRRQDLAAQRATALHVDLGRSIRDARLAADLSLGEVARASGISVPQASRIERGLAPSLTFTQAAGMGAAVGLDLSARLYPAGDAIRDAAHSALIQRLRARIHPDLLLATEVPLPIPGDRRAWDAVIRGVGWQVPVEAETRPRDLQALDRRIALKLRDSGLEEVLLVSPGLCDESTARRRSDAVGFVV